MTDRREFLKTAAAAASILTVSSVSTAFASSAMPYTNIVYTADNPGKWKGKAGSHAPQVEVMDSKVTIMTKHSMSNEHFIVRHTLVLEDGTYIGAKNFQPTDKAESSFDLPAGYKGKIFATSFCNLHDFWLTETVV